MRREKGREAFDNAEGGERETPVIIMPETSHIIQSQFMIPKP